MKVSIAAVVLGVVLGIAANPALAGRHDPMVVPAYQPVTTTNGIPPSAARIKAAILHGAQKRRWQVVATEPGRVTLRYAPRTHEVVVAVRYDDNGFKIEYVSSVDMNYRTKKDKAEIHGNYNIWIDNLSNDILASEIFSRQEGEAK